MIRIEGKWRRGGYLEPGTYLRRKIGSAYVETCRSIYQAVSRNGYEYLGPIEIVEPYPEPTPLPGCTCDVGHEIAQAYFRAYCRSVCNGDTVLSVFGETRQQAILLHNAAVAAIIAMHDAAAGSR